VSPRASLDTEATGKNLSPLPAIEPRSPERSTRGLTLYRLGYPGSPAFELFLSVPSDERCPVGTQHDSCCLQQAADSAR
jgi:hypothetical protein